MQHGNTRRGFTLMELLVVVLIIGVLVAIAVSQYQKAVTKANVMEALTVLSALVQAQEVFFLENGRYTNDLSQLDIKLPQANTKKYKYFCRTDWKCCQAESKNLTLVPSIEYNFSNVVSSKETEQPSRRTCIAMTGAFSDKVCKSMTKTEKVAGRIYSYYNINL